MISLLLEFRKIRAKARENKSQSKFIVYLDALMGQEGLGKQIYLNSNRLGISSSNELTVFKVVNQVHGDIFLDIGSCRGGYCLTFARNFKHVIAFEPDEINFKVLSDSIRLLRKRNVHPLKLAVSDHDGEITFYQSDSPFLGTTMQEFSYANRHGITIPCIRLDSFVKEPIELIKVDVQGAELDVLRGARKSIDKIVRWIVEVENFELEKKSKIESQLRDFGYATKWITNQHIFAF